MKKIDLEKDKINKLLLTFTIPCVISMLVNSIYNIVDQIFIGWGVGYLGNGATNVVFPLVVISFAIAFMTSDGSAAFLSLNLGEKDYEEAKKGIGSALVFITLVSLVLLIVFSIFLPKLLLLFGCTKLIYPYAIDYGRIIILGLPFSMMSIVLNAMIRSDGSPKYSMMCNLIGAAINIILDAILERKIVV